MKANRIFYRRSMLKAYVLPILCFLMPLMTLPRAAAIDLTAAGLKNISQADIAILESGQALVRPVRNRHEIALIAPGELADTLRHDISVLNPNYLSEVIALIPAEEKTLDNLAASLIDVKEFIGIPYYSKRQNTFYDLFDRMDIERQELGSSGGFIQTLQHMEPFDAYRARYDYAFNAAAGQNSVFFKAANLEPLVYYGGISAVGIGNMLWLLYAYEYTGHIVFYGVGAFKAFDFFGLIRDRLETSLIGRVDAFFGFMKKTIDQEFEKRSADQ